jgi:hypothetical protein
MREHGINKREKILEPARAGDSGFSVKPFSEYFKQASACDHFGFDLKAAVASSRRL